MHGLYRLFDDEIALNHQIESAEARGQDTTSLLDTRSKLRREIQKKCNSKEINHDVLGAFIVFESTVLQEFIVDLYRDSYSWIGRSTQTPQMRFMDTYKLKVECASEPSSINWDNMDFSSSRRKRILILTGSLTVLLLICSIAISIGLYRATTLLNDPKKNFVCDQFFSDTLTPEALGNCYSSIDSTPLNPASKDAFDNLKFCYCKNNVESLYSNYTDICSSYTVDQSLSVFIGFIASIIIAAINFILKIFFVLFVDVENYQNTTAEQKSLCNRLFISQFFNTVIVMLIVNAWWGPNVDIGSFDDFNRLWYVKVCAAIVLTMLLNVIILPLTMLISWVLNKVFRIIRGASVGSCLEKSIAKLIGGRVMTEYELNRVYTLPDFELSIRFAPMINIVLSCMALSAGAPLLNVIACASFLMMFLIDRNVLVKLSHSSTYYDASIGKSCVIIMQRIATFVHLAFGFWMFSHPTISPSSPLSNTILDAMNQTENGYTNFEDKYYTKFREARANVTASAFPALISLQEITGNAQCSAWTGAANQVYSMHTTTPALDIFNDILPAFANDRTLAYVDATNFDIQLRTLEALDQGLKLPSTLDGFGSLQRGYDIWSRAFQKATMGHSVGIILIGTYLVYKYLLRILIAPAVLTYKLVQAKKRINEKVNSDDTDVSDRVDDDPTLTYSLALIDGSIPSHLGMSYHISFARTKYREMYDRYVKLQQFQNSNGEDGVWEEARKSEGADDLAIARKENAISPAEAEVGGSNIVSNVAMSPVLKNGRIPPSCIMYAIRMLQHLNGISSATPGRSSVAEVEDENDDDYDVDLSKAARLPNESMEQWLKRVQDVAKQAKMASSSTPKSNALVAEPTVKSAPHASVAGSSSNAMFAMLNGVVGAATSVASAAVSAAGTTLAAASTSAALGGTAAVAGSAAASGAAFAVGTGAVVAGAVAGAAAGVAGSAAAHHAHASKAGASTSLQQPQSAVISQTHTYNSSEWNDAITDRGSSMNTSGNALQQQQHAGPRANLEATSPFAAASSVNSANTLRTSSEYKLVRNPPRVEVNSQRHNELSTTNKTKEQLAANEWDVVADPVGVVVNVGEKVIIKMGGAQPSVPHDATDKYLKHH
eukprot:GDKK01067513.1.p1 GENE.GDKK01067513.1~~GDKK01067513.1.p1  ORF type:complete len:1115 (+),score=370.31 GDKK01067513.1:1-3345(+)